jgi:hypothetical protein
MDGNNGSLVGGREDCDSGDYSEGPTRSDQGIFNRLGHCLAWKRLGLILKRFFSDGH